MPDPTVHITNGIPDLGTGNITTLGMTLVDGANTTLGATTDAAIVAGAAGTINAHLRSISRDIVNGIVLATGSNNIGSVTQGSPPWSQNVTQFGGNAIATGTGIGGLGIPRVTVSSDSSLAATQSGSWDIRNITGTVPLPSGASTSAKQPALGTAGVPSADVITVQGIASGVAQPVTVSGTATVSGTVAATQSGPWSITNISGTVSLPTGAATVAKQPQPTAAGTPSTDIISVQGNASMIPLLVSQNVAPWTIQRVQTAANNNLTSSRVNAAASTNATSLKASAGEISAIDVFNVATYMVFLKLYNKASAPTVGTDTPVWTIPIPAGGGYSIDASTGEYFSTGIAYAITKLQPDSDTTAVAAGDVTGRIKWV